MNLTGIKWSFSQPLRINFASIMLRREILVLATVALGIILGNLMLAPVRETAVSLIVILVYFVTVAINPLYGLLLWIVTQPLADLYVNLPLGEGIPDLSPTRFCILFVTVLLLARASISKIKLLQLSKTEVVAILFAIGITLSAPNGKKGWQSFQSILDLLIVPIFVFFLAKNLVKDQKQFEKIISVLLILATYVGLYAIYEQLTGQILFSLEEHSYVDYGEGLRVLRGLLGHPHPFGRLLDMAIPFGFYFLLEEKRPAKRVLYVLMLGIMFLGLYLTYRRTAWIACIASLFLIQCFYSRFRNLFLVLLVVGCGAMVLNQDQLGDSAVSNRIQAGNTATLNGRTEGWEFAIELWKRQPITGHGYAQFNQIAEREGRRDTAIESQYMHILVSAGLLGFVPYVLLLLMIPLSLAKTFWSGDNSPVDRRLIAVFWGAHLSYLINAYTATVGQTVTTSALFLLAGALFGIVARASGKKDQPVSANQAVLLSQKAHETAA